MANTRFARQSPRQPSKTYDQIAPGSAVTFFNLKSQADRNGDRGTIASYSASKNRYIVRLEDSNDTLSVSPANLQQHPHVTVAGLSAGNAALNGAQGQIVTFDERCGRYLTYLSRQRKTISLRPSNVVLANGTVAVTHSLNAAGKNGIWGTVEGYDESKGRLQLRVSQEEVLKVKLENVKV